VTDPTDGLKNDPGLLGILGEAVMLAKWKLTSATLFEWVSSIHGCGRSCADIQPC
jgi:hypothetical protein